MLVDESAAALLVVDGQRGDPDIEIRESVARPLERRELCVAVRAPRSAIDQDDAEVAGQVLWQAEGPSADLGNLDLREELAVVEPIHDCCSLALSRRAMLPL